MTVQAVHAGDIDGSRTATVDEALAAGMDMMLLNGSLLRNGDNVWQRMREGFQLPEVNPELVRKAERQYAGRPDTFRRTLDRSRKYLFHIMNEVERRGMPTELALLPIVESSFVPTASSPVGAAGLWQFMPATGRQYGLEQTWWYDGRRDVVEATRAALDYLQTLYAQFGDWNLALAAYNWGEGNLARAIARTQAAGQDITYENLRLPAETRNYAPKLLAVRNIMAAPEKFGLRLDKFPNKPYFVSVSTGRHMDIDLAARLAGVSVTEFRELNPAFNLPVYAHKPGRQMLIPVAKAGQFESALARWDKPLLSWKVVTPQEGQSAAEIAGNAGMSVAQLLSVNKLSSPSLNPGRPILVALKDNRDTATSLDVLESTASAATVAEAAPVSAPVRMAVTETAPEPARASPPAVQLAEATPIRAVPVARTTIQVPAAPQPARTTGLVQVSDSAPASRAVDLTATTHTVASGDTLYNISRRYNLSVAELKALNGLDADVVRIGDTLKVKARPILSAGADESVMQVAHVATPVPTPRASATEYIVRRGDTVYSIARRFGVNHGDIQRWNEGSLKRLQPGQVVRVQGL